MDRMENGQFPLSGCEFKSCDALSSIVYRRVIMSLNSVAVLPIFLRNEMKKKYKGVRGEFWGQWIMDN